MVEGIISLLITVCFLAIIVYLVIWVLGIIGIPLPEKVVQILWVIVALIVLLLLWRLVSSHGGVNFRLSMTDYLPWHLTEYFKLT